MCEFCTKHGEGKKWYLNAKNYGYDLLSDSKRAPFVRDHLYWTDSTYRKYFNIFKYLPVNIPIIGPTIKAIIKRKYLYEHWGQVVPIEDVESVLAFTNSITRLPCICRKVIFGEEARKCFFISLDPASTGIADIVDQSYFGGPDVARFEKVEKDWVIKFMRESEMKGMIHTIWTFRAPFIGGFCNCNVSSGCIPMKMYKEVTPVVFRSEYICIVNSSICSGCRACLSLCQFGAMKYDKNDKKVAIDLKRCYGCGICRSVCKMNAIRLESRRSKQETFNLW